MKISSALPVFVEYFECAESDINWCKFYLDEVYNGGKTVESLRESIEHIHLYMLDIREKLKGADLD